MQEPAYKSLLIICEMFFAKRCKQQHFWRSWRGGSPYLTVEIKSVELNSKNQGRDCKSGWVSWTNYPQRFVFHTYEQVYVTTWNHVHVLLCAGDGEARGWGWNSVFLYGKHFAFTWDRASCGSGLDFSVQRYYVQGYQHTGWHFFTGIVCSVLGWESCWPVWLVCGCVFVCLSKQIVK